ncbi:6-phosphofructokinase [Thecamonas trahens ATCC 50062]|uniref:6-phosphofructokinase n=1 Tax=Thecamonas trahens ATCC 50062 TaxID=461836 RepID=A0A0L0DUX1_THETB|nr:6-phosphofructokinase [Thecamonas trahens ATCC 50062]KNC55997.1 6-phosphofructokinase [Thecamonas trahens ATCC 50062]|eukprot:XP_013761043.1 6-phosphofructokinase [Thecamonas trahens ATCC 50062]
MSGTMRSVCVLTSGGDSQGMNAALRGVARASLSAGVKVFAVWDGYKGLVEGVMSELSWLDCSNMVAAGGTKYGTARCAQFRTEEGRRAAVVNLVKANAGALVVIGGDGSLTGASILASEWDDHVQKAVANGELPQDFAAAAELHVVGLVGSIDNDMFGTHFTIGCVSALHRIVEAVDAIRATAASHSRTFVVEVMGRNCGWLALMAGLATQADFVFIPESPPSPCTSTSVPTVSTTTGELLESWAATLVAKLARVEGKRWSVVIVSEGAHDCKMEPITAARIKEVIEAELGHDTRITKLGHVQRGGKPAAFDRYMSTNLGIAAFDALAGYAAAGPPAPEPVYFGCSDASVYPVALHPAVAATRNVHDLVAAGKYDDAMVARGAEYPQLFRMLRTLLRSDPHDRSAHALPDYRVAIMHVGAPAPGMNAAVATLTRIFLDAGVSDVVGIHNGFEGLAKGKTCPLTWAHVREWVPEGGAKLGTTRTLPADLAPAGTPPDKALEWLIPHLSAFNALVIIGGFEAASILVDLADAAPRLWPHLSGMLIPATISNNVPCTQYSIGTDTALNAIVEACDRVKQSAYSSAHRVFVVEVMGARCGFLATMAGLAAGAEKVYTHERGISAAAILADVKDFCARFTASTESNTPRSALVITANAASETYTTPMMCALYEAESDGIFSVRASVLGYLQQGGSPTPLDRIRGIELAAASAARILELRDSTDTAFLVCGTSESAVIFSDMSSLDGSMDRANRRPRCQWWDDLATRNISITSAETEPHPDFAPGFAPVTSAGPSAP